MGVSHGTAWALGVGLGLIAASQTVGAAVFSDGTFAPASWTQIVVTQTGSAQAPTFSQQLAGGNPGAYRRMSHSFTAGPGSLEVYHEYTGGSFDPSTLGAGEVLVLDYSEDHIVLSAPLLVGVGAAPAVKQDGIVYAAPVIASTANTWATQTVTGLSAADFTAIGGTGHPDFTASGGEITFGYYRRNGAGTGGGAFTVTHGIDDWSFTTSVVTAGTVFSEQKISDTAGGFGGVLANSDRFGECVAYLGDVDGDGVGDLATSTLDDGVGTDAGAIWILFMNPDDTVKAETEIVHGTSAGDFRGPASPGDRLGQCPTGIGDLNYDGVPDLAAGSEQAGDGALWILFLNADGTLRSEKRIGDGDGGLPAGLVAPGDSFGRDVARLGDVDGDGVVDIAVGAPSHDDGGSDRGAVFVLFLEPDGYVKGVTQISHSTLPGLGLDDGDSLGNGIAGLGDVDGDGVPDLVAGALFDEDIGTNAGAVHVLLLNPDGTVKAHQKLGDGAVGGGLNAEDRFGIGVAGLGDIDGDGVPDLAVGASRDDDGGSQFGAVWVLLLNADGSAKGFQKISQTTGGFTGPLNTGDEFGMAVEGYRGADGTPRLAAGARQDDDGGLNRGALYVLELAGVAQPIVCGDFLREGSEECDDGNTLSGDTCSAACEVEDVMWLRGTAAGGNVSATVSGELVAVATVAGQSAEQVLGALAAAIDANVTLQGLGVSAVAVGQVLYTTGTLTGSASSDVGLAFGERDDLVLEGSQLELGFLLVAPSTTSGVTLVEQTGSSLALSVAETGGFTLPGGVLSGSGVGHGPIACAAGAGTPVSNAVPAAATYPVFGPFDLYIEGPPGVRCTGGLSGHWSVLFSQPAPGVTVSYNLAPVGVGGTVDLGGRLVGGLPWTRGTAVAEYLASTPTPISNLPYLLVRQTTLRGVEARRADGIGVFNPVSPIAFNSAVCNDPQCNQLVFRTLPEANFAQLRLRFVPEPALPLGLGAGMLVLLLVAVGQGRRGRR